MPVLSELIAEVEPSVSTERSRLTMAPAAASVVVPARQDRRDHRRQAGRDGRDGERDGGQEQLVERRCCATGPMPIEISSATPAMTRIWLVSALSCRVSGVTSSLVTLEHAADVADLGRHAGGGHEDRARAAGDLGVHERQVDAIAEPGVGRDGLDLLGHRDALAGQRGLVDLEGRRA